MFIYELHTIINDLQSIMKFLKHLIACELLTQTVLYINVTFTNYCNLKVLPKYNIFLWNVIKYKYNIPWNRNTNKWRIKCPRCVYTYVNQLSKWTLFTSPLSTVSTLSDMLYADWIYRKSSSVPKEQLTIP